MRVLGACKMGPITAAEFWTRARAERAAEPAAKTAWPALEALCSPAESTFHPRLRDREIMGVRAAKEQREAAIQRAAWIQCLRGHLQGPSLALFLPVGSGFFLLPLLTGGITNLSAPSLGTCSLMPLCLQCLMGPPPSLPGAYMQISQHVVQMRSTILL